MVKVLAAQINPIIGDLEGNQKKILKSIEIARQEKCDFVLTPEMALTGYPPEDMLFISEFVEKAEKMLPVFIEASKGIGLIIGTIRANLTKGEKPLFNTALICHDQKLLGFQDKQLLPSYDVFNERRYFEPGCGSRVWHIGEYQVGITICEDIWQDSYKTGPLDSLLSHPIDLMLNLSASPFHIEKLKSRIQVVKRAAKTLHCPVILCNQAGGNDSLIFDGKSLMANKEGSLTYMAKGFEEEACVMNTSSTATVDTTIHPMEELTEALTLGIKDYFAKLGFKKACLGISGGIDSALVACLAVKALGKDNVLGIAMPSRYSSEDSLADAKQLVKRLEIPLEIISIESPFESFLDLLTPHFENKAPDVTEENLQARIRGIILMAFSNKHSYIVLSTGNKSELALSYSTLYGDMCGGLAVISDLTKNQVYALSHYINTIHHWIPDRILTKAPSAELKPNQKDTDSLPEYAIVDTVLEAYVEYGMNEAEIAKRYKIDKAVISDLIKKIHASEYKRRQSPPGLIVTKKAFSKGWHFPIVQKWR